MSKHLVVAAIATLAAGGVLAADVGAGGKLYEERCASCHGKDAKSPIDATYPILAGQYSDYLFKALNDYHSGARKNAIMGAMAKPLSKGEMRNLSAYLASLPGPLTHRK